VILCHVDNRTDPCEIRASIIAKDERGSSLFAIDLESGARVGKYQRAVLKKPLGALESEFENQIVALRIGDVERRNILQRGEEENGHGENTSPESLREQKIRNLKENFLK
jgi:hypothetical protein